MGTETEADREADVEPVDDGIEEEGGLDAELEAKRAELARVEARLESARAELSKAAKRKQSASSSRLEKTGMAFEDLAEWAASEEGRDALIEITQAGVRISMRDANEARVERVVDSVEHVFDAVTWLRANWSRIQRWWRSRPPVRRRRARRAERREDRDENGGGPIRRRRRRREDDGRE